MKISLACDHGGLQLKTFVKDYLLQQGHDVVDCGTNSLDSCDYPDFGIAVAEQVADGGAERGIVICTTGIGISIAANKVKGIRCSLCGDLKSAEMTRRHNDANVLAMGAAIIPLSLALEITDVWMNTPFEGGRHARRVDKINAYDASREERK